MQSYDKYLVTNAHVHDFRDLATIHIVMPITLYVTHGIALKDFDLVWTQHIFCSYLHERNGISGGRYDIMSDQYTIM
jgi:hypothetical protein